MMKKLKKLIWVIIIILVFALGCFIISLKEKEEFVPLSEYNKRFHNSIIQRD